MGNLLVIKTTPPSTRRVLKNKSEYKIMLQGDVGVGKSTFPLQYIQNIFIEK